MSRPKNYDLIDLFAGCGGMTLGFLWNRLFHPHEANPVCRRASPPPSPFRVAWANDYNRDALDSYKANFDVAGVHAVCGPIQDALRAPGVKIPAADVVIGGPPCQGFSLLNRHQNDDERRELWRQFMTVVERSEARIVVMENVPQFLRSHEFQRMTGRLERLGFKYLMAHVLCAANYGVPQVRHRAIVLASRAGPITLPLPTHFSEDRFEQIKGQPRAKLTKREQWVPVRQVFTGLGIPMGTEIRDDANQTDRLHFVRSPTTLSLERYRAVPRGGNRFDLQRNRPDLTPRCWSEKASGGTDLFGRLHWDRPSVTIRTEFFKPEKGRYLHPDKHRTMTHREAARLQSFPDSFHFVGSKIEIAKQIGNAVPPLLAYAIAKEVQASLEGRTTREDMLESCETFETALGERIRRVWLGSPLFEASSG
jgi:DNA (cytosine-5)-methyltransferase 1